MPGDYPSIEAAEIWAVCPGRWAKKPPEEGWHADNGRGGDSVVGSYNNTLFMDRRKETLLVLFATVGLV